MLEFIEYLDVPAKVAIVVVAALLVMNLIGAALDFKGKVVPEVMTMYKFFSRRKAKRDENEQDRKKIRELLEEVNRHYSADNITKRNEWMNWVNNRAEVYDQSIDRIVRALDANTKLTEEMFVQSSRDRIIDFSYKAADYGIHVSREEYNRIFKVYDKYEKFLREHDMTNGEVDISYGLIRESYEKRVKEHLFIEDVRG